MATYRHPHRRLEFVSGRLALKGALLETQSPAVRVCSARPLSAPLLSVAQQMGVLPDADGRPRLRVGNHDTPTHVSIAHAVGWAAAACSPTPIGVDIVDTEAPTAVPANLPWLAGVEPEWLPRLRALLWGLRESLLKSGEIAAKTVWALGAVDAVPTCSASDIIARWPSESNLTALQVHIENKTFAGAFVPLSQSALLVMILRTVPPSTDGMHLQ